MCIGIKGLGEGGSGDKWKRVCVCGGGVLKPICLHPLFVNELRDWELTLTVRQNLHFLLNIDVIYYCLQNFVWTNKTIIEMVPL